VGVWTGSSAGVQANTDLLPSILSANTKCSQPHDEMACACELHSTDVHIDVQVVQSEAEKASKGGHSEVEPLVRQELIRKGYDVD
jgi:hypothetical protein